MINRKNIIIVVVIVFFVAILSWLYRESVRSLPGTKIEDLGRKHVPIGEEVKYNSNPPTSGSHYEDWVRSGVFDKVKDDRNLVHSLEHGYVILSYNCDHKEVSFNLIKEAFAHEEDLEASGSADIATSSAVLSENFKSQSCQNLVKQLTDIYNRKGQKRIVVVPRPNLDTRIALTAWNYLDKFDKFDKGRIERFIDAHLNNGPEKTQE